MSQEHTSHTQPDKKNGQKPASSPPGELLTEVTGMLESPVVSIAASRDGIAGQAMHSTAARLQTIQRQLMAKQVGLISGNRYMQQAFSRPIQAQAAALPPVQRDTKSWSDAAEENAKTSQDKVAPPKDAGWNEGKVLINNIWRIPIEGLSHGNTSASEDPGRAGLTPESAVGKAVVLQHKEFKKDKPARVLLHLHGFGAGYRQLVEHHTGYEKELQKLKEEKTHPKPKAARIKQLEKLLENKHDYAGALQLGQVRDVDLYRMEQQLDALQDPQTMAVLPQGTSSSGFGDIAKKPTEYLDEALGKLKDKPADYHIVLSGHSGGGPTVLKLANKLAEEQKAGEKNSQVDEMVLFDAINSDGERGNVETFLKEKLRTELAKLKAQPKSNQKDWIEKNGFRFRGYNSGGKSHPRKKDEKGNPMWEDPETKKKPLYDTSRWVGYGWQYSELDKSLRKWFKDNANDLAPDVRASLESNYQIFEVTKTSHETLMGSRRAAEKGKPAPSKAGVLHEALSALPGQSPAATSAASVTAPAPVAHTPAIPEAAAPQIKIKNTQKEEKTKKKEKKGAADAASQAALTEKEREHLPELKEAQKRYKELAAQGKKLGDKEKTEKKKLGEDLKAGGRIFAKAAMEKDIVEAGTTVQKWFGGIVPQATFMDIPIRPSGASQVGGVHQELLTRLEMAEKNLIQLMDKAYGKTPAFSSKSEYAAKVGLYSVNGLRLPGNATGGSRPSMHCYGLAIDVNYKGNPFVGNAKKIAKTAPEVIRNATLLIEGKKMDALEKPGKKGALEMWDRLHRESEALKTYLSLRKDENKKLLESYVKESGSTRTVEEWQKLIDEDYAAVYNEKKGKGKGDFEGHSDAATSGFMDLSKLLVEALTQAGLLWGGQYNSAKDIMHFDWRQGTIKH